MLPILFTIRKNSAEYDLTQILFLSVSSLLDYSTLTAVPLTLTINIAPFSVILS